MKGCHNCEHATAIAEGKYAEQAWEEIPCANCDVMTGMGFAIEFDEKRVGEIDPMAAVNNVGVLPVAVMQEIMVGFLKLKPELRDVVAWRYAGMKYDDIALLQGVTTACAEKRHRRAMELWPALESLFPRKVAKQAMRKPRGGSEA